MNIQIPIIGQQTRVGFTAQDYQSPIVVDDERGAALQGFGRSLGDLAAGVAAWQKKQPQTTTTTATAPDPNDYVTPNDPAPADPGDYATPNDPVPAGSGIGTLAGGHPPPPEMGEPAAYNPVHANPVARQDYEIAKSAACYAVPDLRNAATRIFADARQSLGPSQAGLVPAVLEPYDRAVDQAVQACTTPEARLYVTEYAKQGRQQLARQALVSEAQAGIAERANRYQASAEAWAQVVAGDPGQIATALTALHHGMPDLDPGQREASRDNARTTLIHAGIMAEIARNPQGAYNDLVGAGGREDGAPGEPQAQDSGALATLTHIMTPAEREHYAPLAQAALYDQQAKQFEAFKTRQADTDAAYMATGTAQNPPTEPEFIEHYGQEEGQRLFGQQRITARAGQVRQFVKTLPAHALTDLREEADPATPEGAAVHHVIGEVEKARRADPIAYALQNGSYGLSPITSFDDAQSLKTELGKRRRAAGSIAEDYQATTTVLSRDEGKLLAKSLQGKTVDEQKALLLQLTDGIGDPQVAQGALRVLSTADPLAALAGQHQANEADQRVEAQAWGGGGKLDAPRLLLRGQALLQLQANAPKAQAVVMPVDGEIRELFGQRLGAAYTDQPGMSAVLYAGTRACYAGITDQCGDTSGKLNEERLNAAMYLAEKGSATPEEAGLVPVRMQLRASAVPAKGAAEPAPQEAGSAAAAMGLDPAANSTRDNPYGLSSKELADAQTYMRNFLTPGAPRPELNARMRQHVSFLQQQMIELAEARKNAPVVSERNMEAERQARIQSKKFANDLAGNAAGPFVSAPMQITRALGGDEQRVEEAGRLGAAAMEMAAARTMGPTAPRAPSSRRPGFTEPYDPSKSLADKIIESPSGAAWGFKWNGAHQGNVHFVDYWLSQAPRFRKIEERLGLEVGTFSQSVAGFDRFTGHAQRVTRQGEEKVLSDGRKMYYLPSVRSGDLDKVGVIVVTRDGKLQSMMAGDRKYFLGQEGEAK